MWIRWFFCILTVFSLFSKELGVTYSLSGGRFGDGLLSYLHAKWIACQRNSLLFYKSFPYSSELVLSKKEIPYKGIKAEKVLWGDPHPKKTPYVYVCPYFPENEWEQKNSKDIDGKEWRPFKVDWKNPEFRKAVRALIAPRKKLNLIIPPEGHLSVAMHIREGGGFDSESIKMQHPLKFPPIQYYIECLLSLIEKYRGERIYCYVFTDAEHPDKIVEIIEKHLPMEAAVIFDYQKNGNKHDANVLEDFFSLFHFNILIRSISNFSLVPSLLKDFDLVYSPLEFSFKEGKPIITKIEQIVSP